MNQRLLIALIILAGIGSIGSVLAYSGSISAAQGNFNNVLVTGNCSGCGASEGSYTNYNTVSLNTTLGLGTPDATIRNIVISNAGNVLSSGDTNNIFTTLAGSVVFTNSSYASTGSREIGQSISGVYAIVLSDTTNPPTIAVLKNGVYLQVLGIDMSQFTTPVVSARLGMAISPDGHYIGIIGKDSGGTDDRLIILKGS